MALREISPNVVKTHRTELPQAIGAKVMNKTVKFYHNNIEGGTVLKPSNDQMLAVMKGALHLQQIEMNRIRRENAFLKLSLHAIKSVSTAKSIVTPKKRRLALKDHDHNCPGSASSPTHTPSRSAAKERLLGTPTRCPAPPSAPTTPEVWPKQGNQSVSPGPGPGGRSVFNPTADSVTPPPSDSKKARHSRRTEDALTQQRESDYVRAVISLGARTVDYDRLGGGLRVPDPSQCTSGTKRHHDHADDELTDHLSRLHMYNPTPVERQVQQPPHSSAAECGRHISFEMDGAASTDASANVDAHRRSPGQRRHIHTHTQGTSAGHTSGVLKPPKHAPAPEFVSTQPPTRPVVHSLPTHTQLSEEEQFHQALHKATSGAMRTMFTSHSVGIASPVATQFATYAGKSPSCTPTSAPVNTSHVAVSELKSSEQQMATLVPLSDIPALQSKLSSWREKYK